MHRAAALPQIVEPWRLFLFSLPPHTARASRIPKHPSASLQHVKGTRATQPHTRSRAPPGIACIVYYLQLKGCPRVALQCGAVLRGAVPRRAVRSCAARGLAVWGCAARGCAAPGFADVPRVALQYGPVPRVALQYGAVPRAAVPRRAVRSVPRVALQYGLCCAGLCRAGLCGAVPGAALQHGCLRRSRARLSPSVIVNLVCLAGAGYPRC